MICLKEYKSIIITLSVIALIAAGVVNYVKDLIGQPPESAPEHLQVKAPAEKILHSQKIKDEQGNDIVKYLYASETEVPAKTIKIDEREIKEDISKRTKNAQFFKKAVNKDNNQNADTQNGSTAPVAAGDNGVVAANESEKEVWVGRFYAGEPFYKDAGNNKWYQTETATTTAEEFSKQTKPNFLAGIKSFFRMNALADTESYYAGAGDGHVYGSGGSWATAHNALSGNSAVYQDVNLSSGVGIFGGSYFIFRAFFPFDTSDIDDGATIDSAILKAYATTKINDDNDGNDWMNIVQTSQADTASLALGDYDQCGAITNPTEGATRIDFGNITTSAYNSWTLNTTGIGWVDKTGVSELGMREGHDALNDPITPVTGTDWNYSSFSVFETTGTSQDPYLEITYTVPAAPAKFRFDGGQMKIKGKVKFE